MHMQPNHCVSLTHMTDSVKSVNLTETECLPETDTLIVTKVITANRDSDVLH